MRSLENYTYLCARGGERTGQLAGVSVPLSLCGTWHGAQGSSLDSWSHPAGPETQP